MVLYGRTSSLSIGGGVGDARSSGSWARSVHGGAGGLGVNISQASQSLLLGASRGGVGGGFYSGGGSGIGVGLGSGFGASSAGFGVGLGGGSGFGSGAGFGGSAGFGSGAGFGGGTGFGGGAGLGGGAGFGAAAAFKSGAGFGGGAGGAIDGILGNEKFTMRILNERLASYLKKVQLLEKANTELELKISQFVESRTSPTARDYTDSLSTITDLQNSINDAFQLKEVVYINLDNATLAADDFRVKYETELALRQTVEADVSELKKLLNDIFMHKTELMLQIETLNEEKSYIKKLHKEEMVATRSKMSGQIHVEVDSAPQQDLTSILDDIRDHYEAIATKNRRDLETWFKSKLETLSQEVVSSTQTVESSKNELSVEKTKVQGLELELHSAMAVKSSLAAKLAEAQAFYSTYLSGYQQQVLSLEEQLLQLRADLERQSRDYQTLLDIKTRLELEIAEYRRLLDQGAEGGAVVTTSSSSTSQTATQNQAGK